jgi:hypothetical protein
MCGGYRKLSIVAEYEKRKQLQARLERAGYTLYGITEFKNHDRVVFGNKNLKISLNLRGKLSEYALEAIVKACIGKEAS